MKKKLISLAAAALLTCSAVMTASAAETARGMGKLRQLRRQRPEDGPDLEGGCWGRHIKHAAVIRRQGRPQLKLTWEQDVGWGGIGRDVNEDWSMFEGVRINVKDGRLQHRGVPVCLSPGGWHLHSL